MDIKLIYDPMFHHLDMMSHKGIEDNCSVVFHWAMQSHLFGVGMQTILEDHYGEPRRHMSGGVVLNNGLYKYPEDEDLYPLCRIETEAEIIFFYFYDILAVRNKITDDVYITRVD